MCWFEQKTYSDVVSLLIQRFRLNILWLSRRLPKRNLYAFYIKSHSSRPYSMIPFFHTFRSRARNDFCPYATRRPA